MRKSKTLVRELLLAMGSGQDDELTIQALAEFAGEDPDRGTPENEEERLAIIETQCLARELAMTLDEDDSERAEQQAALRETYDEFARKALRTVLHAGGRVGLRRS